ncbi:MAG: hypothetical protein AAGI52_13030 [Bacteroidota bacterium]
MTRLLLVATLLAPLAHAQSLRADGPPVRLAGSDEAPLAHAAWSPTGELAASRPDATGLWLVAEDGTLRALTDGPTFGFEWSPDGTTILFRAAREDGPRRDHAPALLDIATGETTLLADWRGSMPSLPRFSADGTSALVATDGAVESFPTGASASVAASTAPVVLKSAEAGVVARGTETSRFAPVEGRLLNLTPSPDRQRVAFEVMGSGLYLANADGSGLVSLGEGQRPTWSPDGRWVAFMRAEDDGHHFTGADLWAARTDGSETIRLTSAPGLEMNPDWRPDGSALAYDNGEALFLLSLASE